METEKIYYDEVNNNGQEWLVTDNLGYTKYMCDGCGRWMRVAKHLYPETFTCIWCGVEIKK